jgi:two-component system, chemotaxis family, chemotaxis protein CheY
MVPFVQIAQALFGCRLVSAQRRKRDLSVLAGAGRQMALDGTLPILVVDDYPSMVRILRQLLKQVGFDNVDEAYNGAEALSKMREKRYALIISDWVMEPMTGLELLTEMRGDDELKEIPFIMVTAESKSERVREAKLAGVDNYIVKPFNAATLKMKIAALA